MAMTTSTLPSSSFWQDFLGHRLGQGLFQAAQVGDIVADAHPQHRPVLDAGHLRAGHELGFLPAEQGQEQHQQKPAEDQQGLTIGPALVPHQGNGMPAEIELQPAQTLAPINFFHTLIIASLPCVDK